MTVQEQTSPEAATEGAVEYEVSGRDVYGKFGYEKAIVFLKGDELYSLASLSVYQDHPQFNRFVDSFQFTA